MTQHFIYVPVVKGKSNDVQALGKLPKSIRDRIKPLIEILPVNPTKTTIERHVHNFCRQVISHFPIGEVFVDFYWLQPDDHFEDGRNATLAAFEMLKGMGRIATPVYGLHRNESLWDGIKKVVDANKKGFCFRISRDDLDDSAQDTWDLIEQHSKTLGLTKQETDLLIDLRDVSELDPKYCKELVLEFLLANSAARQYRSIIVSGSCALRHVGSVPKDGTKEISRAELRIWSMLFRDTEGALEPVFSDYGVVHPDFTNSGPNKNMNAKIRYTAGNRIIYFRGHGLLKPVSDFAQYHSLARRVCSHMNYVGPDESFGDECLYRCARKIIRHGNAGTWVLADMNHHVAYTAIQVEKVMAAIVQVETEEEAELALDVL